MCRSFETVSDLSFFRYVVLSLCRSFVTNGQRQVSDDFLHSAGVARVLLWISLSDKGVESTKESSRVFQGRYKNQKMSAVLQTNAHRAQMNILSTMIIVSWSVGFRVKSGSYS